MSAGRHAEPAQAQAPAPTPGPPSAPSAPRQQPNALAVIALGSNLSGAHGDREQLLRAAVRALDALDSVRVTAASPIVETPALKLYGVDETAPSYLNAVVLAESTLQPEMLLGALHGIEASLDRVRTERWGDRTIDLDLIEYGGLVLESDSIVLPHPRAAERAFVLAPWFAVQPDAVLPQGGALAPVADLLAATTDRVTEFAAPALWPAPAAADASASGATT